jgi:hypothetical protein
MVATGPEARQHADQRAQHAAEERIQQVLEGERDAEAEREVVHQVHVVLLTAPMNDGHIGMVSFRPTMKISHDAIGRARPRLMSTSRQWNSSPARLAMKDRGSDRDDHAEPRDGGARTPRSAATMMTSGFHGDVSDRVAALGLDGERLEQARPHRGSP